MLGTHSKLSAAQVAAAATEPVFSLPPPEHPKDRRQILRACKAALKHDPGKAGESLALKAIANLAPPRGDYSRQFRESLALGLSHPALYENEPITVEVGIPKTPIRAGSILLAVWRVGRIYGIGLVRKVCESPQVYETAEGHRLSSQDPKTDWSILGQVFAAGCDGKSRLDSEGLRVNDRGRMIWNDNGFACDSEGLRF